MLLRGEPLLPLLPPPLFEAGLELSAFEVSSAPGFWEQPALPSRRVCGALASHASWAVTHLPPKGSSSSEGLPAVAG